MSAFGNPRESGRPVSIKDEGLSLHSNISSIDFAGAGVDGAAVGSDITETIPGGGGTPTSETPSGLINGVNKVFTITSSNLFALFLNGMFQEAGGVKYTLVGTTITYVTAPRSPMSHKAIIFT